MGARVVRISMVWDSTPEGVFRTDRTRMRSEAYDRWIESRSYGVTPEQFYYLEQPYYEAF